MEVHSIIHVIEVGIGNVTSAVLKLKRKTVSRSSIWLPLGWDNKMCHCWMRVEMRWSINFRICGRRYISKNDDSSADHKSLSPNEWAKPCRCHCRGSLKFLVKSWRDLTNVPACPLNQGLSQGLNQNLELHTYSNVSHVHLSQILSMDVPIPVPTKWVALSDVLTQLDSHHCTTMQVVDWHSAGLIWVFFVCFFGQTLALFGSVDNRCWISKTSNTEKSSYFTKNDVATSSKGLKSNTSSILRTWKSLPYDPVKHRASDGIFTLMHARAMNKRWA